MNKAREYRLYMCDGQLAGIAIETQNEYFVKYKNINLETDLKYGGHQLKNIWRWV